MITVFITSATIMLIELIAGRLVAPYFGQSTQTWAALTGVTLLGCTLGNALGGWLSGRGHGGRAVRPLFVALWMAAAYTVVLPSLLSHYAGFGLVGFVAAGWLPLTIALGCATPLVAALFVRAEKNGSDIGRLYLFSMIGSMLGSLAGGLYLPFVLPADTLYRILAAALLLAPIFVIRQARRTANPQAAQTVSHSAPAIGHRLPTTALLPIFLLGAIGMAVEMTAARQVTVTLGGNHIVWSLIFVSFIGWMGVGGFVGGRLADRFPHRLLVTVSLGLAGIVIAATSVLQTRFSGDSVCLWPAGLRMFVQIILGFAPVAFMLGAASTILLKFSTADALKAGDKSMIGYMYAMSSAGCVVGTFLTGLGLIGTVPSVILMAVFAIAAALAALPDRLSCVFAGLSFVVALFSRTPYPDEIDTNHDQKIVSHRESLYNVVTVTATEHHPSDRTIWLDRIPHTEADVSNPGLLLSSYTRMIAAVVGSRPSNIFMIGGGGYALPVYWNRVDHEGEIVVAEIDPVVKASAFSYLAPTLAKIEREPSLAKAKYAFPAADGRAVADTLPIGHYDFVIGDTISDTAIPYHLVTKEFNDRLKRLLKPGGVSITHTLDTLDRPSILAALVKTLGETYAHVAVLAYTGVTDVRQSLIVVASDDPKAVDLGAATKFLEKEYRNDFYRVVSPERIAAIKSDPSALVLTDRFAPVERYVWRAITRDMQRRGTILGERAKKAALNGDFATARRLALDVLAFEPGQVGAIEALVECALEDRDDREIREVLKAQASRRTGLDHAEKAWKYVQARDAENESSKR